MTEWPEWETLKCLVCHNTNDACTCPDKDDRKAVWDNTQHLIIRRGTEGSLPRRIDSAMIWNKYEVAVAGFRLQRRRNTLAKERAAREARNNEVA